MPRRRPWPRQRAKPNPHLKGLSKRAAHLVRHYKQTTEVQVLEFERGWDDTERQRKIRSFARAEKKLTDFIKDLELKIQRLDAELLDINGGI